MIAAVMTLARSAYPQLLVFGFTMLVTLAAAAPCSGADVPVPKGLAVPNAAMAAPGILTGGAPKAEDLRRLKDAGYVAVINLQGLAEGSLDEAAIADELGLQYVALPITRADITRENAEKLHAAIQLSGTPVFVHCASGNRVGALMALRAYFILDMSPADAMAHGKQAGMTSLSGTVSDVIADAEAEKPE